MELQYFFKSRLQTFAVVALPCEELLQLPWEYKVKYKAIVTNKEGGDPGGSK